MSGIDGSNFGHMNPDNILEKHDTVSENINESALTLNRHDGIDLAPELPFLVTHWLANFSLGTQNIQHDKNSDALNKIRKAAEDLASAFVDIGAFGNYMTQIVEPTEQSQIVSTANHKSNDTVPLDYTPSLKNRTYSDVKRQWGPSCPHEQLEILVESAKSARLTSEAAVMKDRVLTSSNGVNLILAATEAVSASIHAPESGRTVHDDGDESRQPVGNYSGIKAAETSVSSLHPPVFLLENSCQDFQSDSTTSTLQKRANTSLLQSSYGIVANEASQMTRIFLDAKKAFGQHDTCLRSTKRSLDLQKRKLTDLRKQRDAVLLKQLKQSEKYGVVGAITHLGSNRSTVLDGTSDNPLNILGDQGTRDASQTLEQHSAHYVPLITELAEIDSNEQNCSRVIAQLERDLPNLVDKQINATKNSEIAKKNAYAVFSKLKRQQQFYYDPSRVASGSQISSNNRILSNLQVRQLGHFDRFNGLSVPRSLGRCPPQGLTSEIQKSLLYNRFSIAATINCHLHYPIYCLRFDRTGRYFITGADDYLVRVFCLGENIVAKNPKIDRSSFVRGAVLVCTLKGHAGVINDICVSSDNCFLATASEDGDCRVWGLADGCPVAVLRGHKGGANMVSWSTLTPYRLVTTSADGLARIWDIREACLARYGHVVGKRPEYLLAVSGTPLNHINNPITSKATNNGTIDANPMQSNESEQAGVYQIPLPPLPPNLSRQGQEVPDFLEVRDDGNQGRRSQDDEELRPGRFVENDNLDRGVKLLAKLQHGAGFEERASVPGTRSRRAAVKVICVARCPYGVHFATGSDDGICRVWKDEDDFQVEDIDAFLCEKRILQQPMRSSSRKSIEPLLVLDGHLSAVTDLLYSSTGDRILTASQKDGIVKIWSWSHDPCERRKTPGLGSPSRKKSDVKTSHILIKLINPRTAESPSSFTGLRKGVNRTPSHNVCCDVVNWVQDDSKVVTSQTELVKPSGTEIIPGSHYMFLWDSWTGHCLLGISGAHTKQCPILVCHPNHSSIMCSAGADGVLKLWDWESCTCLHSYSNVADFGPLEEKEIGKPVGFLDGTFSPDGTTLVVTDEKGRITIFDCSSVKAKLEKGIRPIQCPKWMKEQYYSNDYYDLLYDETGYCVERGSEKPPHIAPRGSRCSHTGEPVLAQVAETFARLKGPSPLKEELCRWNREEIRRNADVMMQRSVDIRGIQCWVRQFDPQTTLLFESGNQLSFSKGTKDYVDTSETQRQRVRRRDLNSNSAQSLSSNFRWSDAYQEAIRADVDEPDFESDDEEFQLVEGRLAHSPNTASPHPGESLDFDDESTDSSQQSRRLQNLAAPSRVSSRRRRRTYEDQDSDEGDLEEYMSTNNLPSGAFVRDYDVHFFKLTTNRRISRTWVRRCESKQSFEGKKKYSPQVGDLVVYIPRAHLETTQAYPGLKEPWQGWPDDAIWPVVQCRIRNVRYRFPFMHLSNGNAKGQNNKSVVAIVTLEIVGVPSTSEGSSLPWPKPSFIQPIGEHLFEVCLFENSLPDFVLPFTLYTTRLLEMSSYIEEVSKLSTHPEGFQFEIYLANGDDEEEDGLFHSWAAKFEDIEIENEDHFENASLKGSGYNSIRISWLDRDKDAVSPWDTNLKSTVRDQVYETLTGVQKSEVQIALKQIRKSDSNLDFLHPVNESRFSDYGMRIEVPMDLTFIHERVEADYYSNKLSVVADMRLILDNCIKYNGENHDLSGIARSMLQLFEDITLSTDEQSLFQKYNYPILPPNATNVGQRERCASVANTSQRRARPGVSTAGLVSDTRSQPTGRNRARSRTSLESLPPPEDPDTTGSPNSRRSMRRRYNRPSRYSEAQESDEERTGASNSNIRRSARNVSTQNSVHGRALRSSDDYSIANTQAERNGNRPPRRGNRDTNRDIRINASGSGRQTSSPQVHPRIRFVSSRQDSEQRLDSNGNIPSELSRLTSANFPVNDSNFSDVGVGVERDEAEDSLADLPGKQTKSHQDARASYDPSHDTDTPTIAVSKEVASAGDQNGGESDSDDRKPMARPQRRCAKVVSNDNEEAFSSHSESSKVSETESSPSTSKRAVRKLRSVKHHLTEESESEQSRPKTSSKVKRGIRKSRGVKDLTEESGSEQSRTKTGLFDESSSESDEASQAPSRSRSPKFTSGNGRQRIRQSRQSPVRSRATAVTQKSYVDPSSDEFNSTCTLSDSSDESSTRSSRKPTGKRKRKANLRGAVANKKRAPKSSIEHFPSGERWPEINGRQVIQIAKDIIHLLKQLDEKDVFAVPVLETYPQHEEAYRIAVSTPMDFRTIGNRISLYGSIAELQDDLRLVFENCISFTGPFSDTGRLAKKMLHEMDIAFHKACACRHVRPES